MPLEIADHELTDSEILDRYGPLLREAVEAFSSDAHYLADMAENWAAAKAKREDRRARADAARKAEAERLAHRPGPNPVRLTQSQVALIARALSILAKSENTGRAWQAERNSEIVRLVGLGIPQKQIAERFEMSRGMVSGIVKGPRPDDTEV